MKQEVTDKVRLAFADRERFSKNELLAVIADALPGLKPATHKWLVFDLRRRNMIWQSGKNEFSLISKPNYQAIFNQPLAALPGLIAEAFQDMRWCIWSTSWFNEFTIHQFGREIIVIETEKELTNSLFYFLKEQGFTHVFLKPDEKTIELYADLQSILIKPLITRSPLEKETISEHVFFRPKLEKLLVDLHCKEPFLEFIPGAEKENIYKNAFNKYTINLGVMITYARRRGQEHTIRDYINRLMPGMIKEQHND